MKHDLTDGWYPLESDDLLTDFTAVTSDPRNGVLAIALLEFLRYEVSQRLGTNAIGVIRFEFVGAYPALALRASERHVTVEQARVEIERVLDDVPISKFLGFVRARSADWGAELAALLRSREE